MARRLGEGAPGYSEREDPKSPNYRNYLDRNRNNPSRLFVAGVAVIATIGVVLMSRDADIPLFGMPESDADQRPSTVVTRVVRPEMLPDQLASVGSRAAHDLGAVAVSSVA